MKRLVPIIIMVLLLTSCQRQPFTPNPNPGPETQQDYIREDLANLPQEIKDWAENSKDMPFVGQSKVHQDRRYILASYGEAPEGAIIKIEDVEIRADKIIVTISTSIPPNQPIPEIFPQDIVSIANQSLPIEYQGKGETDFIFTLVGIEELPKITGSSPGIKLFAPAPGDKVDQAFIVEGVGNVFEGDFYYLLRDADGTASQKQTAMAGMGDWYYFKLEVEVPEDFSREFTLELFSYSAKDSSIINLVEIPLSKK